MTSFRRIGWLVLFCGTAVFAPAAEKQNVLLIVSDDLAACLGSYGNRVVRTPNLDRLAAEGVRFTRAYCQFPVCGPSRASFMSGLYPEQLGMMGNSYAPGSFRASNPELADHPSVGGFLRRQGMVSLRVSKIFHMGVPFSIESGDPAGDDTDSWDRTYNVFAPESASAGEFTLLSPKRSDFGTSFSRIVVPDGEEGTQADVMSATQAIAIMQSRTRVRGGDERRRLRTEDPFFLAVGFVRPHVPSVAPRRLFDRYPAEAIALPGVPPGDLDDVPEPAAAMRNELRYGMSEAQQREAIAAYYATVEFMDEQVGRLLAELDRLGIRDRTAVIFTSDHGFHLGEHGLWQKTTLFEESLRVPLLVSAPGFRASAGRSCDALVELVDLYPTIADLAGVRTPVPAKVMGRSLKPLLENPAAAFRDHAYSVTGNSGRSIRDARWRYNRWGAAGEELYDLEADPRQFTNLAGQPAAGAVLDRMRAQLRAKQESLGPLPSK